MGQFLQGEKQGDISEVRERLSPQYRRGLQQQLAGLRDDAVGSYLEGRVVCQRCPGECGQRIAHQTRDPNIVRDTHSHDVWNSRVESTMEMSLGDFIDSAHQGGHTHGSVFGNGKL